MSVAPAATNAMQSGPASGAADALSPGFKQPFFGCLSDVVGCEPPLPSITSPPIRLFLTATLSPPPPPSGFWVCVCPMWVGALNKASLDGRECTPCDFFCGSSSYQNRQTIRAKNSLSVGGGGGALGFEILSSPLRGLTQQYHPLNDCVATTCCMQCALHQETREIAAKSGKKAEFFKLPSKWI
jgi:hypothetical protein